MAVLLWSLSESASEMLLRTGPMRGPIATSRPPNHEDQPAGDRTSDASGRGRTSSTSFFSSYAARSGECWCDMVVKLAVEDSIPKHVETHAEKVGMKG